MNLLNASALLVLSSKPNPPHMPLLVTLIKILLSKAMIVLKGDGISHLQRECLRLQEMMTPSQEALLCEFLILKEEPAASWRGREYSKKTKKNKEWILSTALIY